MTAIDLETRNRMEKLVPVIREKIRALYRPLDSKYGLRGALLDILFSWDEDVMGAYVPKGPEREEHFVFSLCAVSFADSAMTAADKRDLFLHEYAHYMARHIDIPKEYQFRGGAHGSAWQYCCSLIGAAPSESYRPGMGTEKHDYSKTLTHSLSDPFANLKNQRRIEEEYRKKKALEVHFAEGDVVQHPKFGEGTVEKLEKTDKSVRVHVRFGDEVKKIDQSWLHRSKFKKAAKKPGPN